MQFQRFYINWMFVANNFASCIAIQPIFNIRQLIADFKYLANAIFFFCRTKKKMKHAETFQRRYALRLWKLIY